MQSDRNSHATVILVGVLCGSDVAPVDLIDLTSMKKKRTQSLCWLNFMADRHWCWNRGLDGSSRFWSFGSRPAAQQLGQAKMQLVVPVGKSLIKGTWWLVGDKTGQVRESNLGQVRRTCTFIGCSVARRFTAMKIEHWQRVHGRPGSLLPLIEASWC